MNILIASATKIECQFLEKHFPAFIVDDNCIKFYINDTTIRLLITGVGIPAAIYQLSKQLVENKYDLVINIGIAGSFHDFEIGEVFHVTSEIFADIGFENGDNFLTLFESGFLKKDSFPYSNGLLISDSSINYKTLQTIKAVKGITVNTITKNIEKINLWKRKFHPNVESMEGAAIFYVCLLEKVKFIQLRAISNKVGVRDKSQWNIPLAIENMEKIVINLLNEIC